ncbi:GGDEF domain-containing protein [Kineococcus rhizosphaerae]|uniref:GGDEF domain-containing protein n=1 Tax=Kineococcus rhizosphaerae TaxID=559628 RepID=UPI00147521E0|nr:GGDEF domain-containing protein [Kineococcus rhizosphaerae]
MALAWPTVLWPHAAAGQVAFSIAQVVVVGLSWAAVRGRTGRLRVVHGCIAAALTSWLAGDALFALWVEPTSTSVVSASDVLWVLGYPLLGVALVSMLRLWSPGRLREAALDGLALTTVFATLTWQYLVVPLLAASDGVGVALVNSFYPVGDVVLFAVGAVLLFAHGVDRGLKVLVVVALSGTLAGDLAVTLLQYHLPDFDTDRLSAVLLVSGAFFVCAQHHPAAARDAIAAAATPRLHPVRVLFLGVALCALPVLLVTEPRGSRYVVLGVMLALSGIVLTRFLIVVRQQEQARLALEFAADHDDLTGLLNREAAHRLVRQRLDRGEGVRVHFLDLDDFKQVNDTFSHAAGDHVLVEVAARLERSVRAGDVLCRLGGDEFVVVTGETSESAALAERLERAIREPVAFCGAELGVGVSIGVASSAGRRRTLEELVKEADAGMYREKRRRKDQTTRGPDVARATSW